MKRPTIITALAFAISVLFVYAALIKAMDYPFFVASLRKSPLLVNYNMPVLAPVVLGIEMVTAILLNIAPVRRTGFYLSFFVMLTFTLYLVVLYYFYKNIPCSCGGILGMMPYPVHIVFNIVFTLMALAGVLLDSMPKVSTTVGKKTGI